MAERVQSGGTKEFIHSGTPDPDDRNKAIRDAYDGVEKSKKERAKVQAEFKKQQMKIFLLILIVGLVLISVFLVSRS